MRVSPYYLLDVLSGAAISVMVACNAQLSVSTSIGVSTIINQIVGIGVLSIVMCAGRASPSICPARKPAPWYLWGNGLFGVAILALNSLTVLSLGASLAMAATVFGQTAFGFLYDGIGFMGLKKRPVTAKKLFSLLVSLLGIVVMASGAKTFSVPMILLGILAGALTITQMVMNSTFASLKGVVFSARQNVIGGLVGCIFWYGITEPSETIKALEAVAGVPPWLLLAGGILGCLIVSGTNIAIIKVPAVYSALLISASQILVSVAIDRLLYHLFTPSLLWGALVLVTGLCVGSIHSSP